MTKRHAANPHFTEDERAAYAGHDIVLREKELEAPLHLRKPARIGVQFMGDLFHQDVPDEWIEAVWAIMRHTPGHTFIVLTKRPERMVALVDRFTWEWTSTEGRTNIVPPNVILGVTVENQARADERIPLLLQCPAAVRFVSYEPALGAVDFTRWVPCDTCQNTGKIGYSSDSAEDCPGCIASGRDIDGTFLDWIICGAETGPGARTMQLSWAYDVMRQCKEASVPFFFKSAGKNIVIPDDLMVRQYPKGMEAE